MKHIATYSVVLLVVTLFGSSCKKSKNNCALTHAKVLRYDCDRVILQIMDNSITGDAQWVNDFTGASYSNVVSYYNTCAFSSVANDIVQDIYIEGARVVVNTLPSPPAGCMQCQAISQNPPQTKIDMDRFLLLQCTGEK